MKYDIVSLKRKMLVKYPFFGNVITNVNFKENENIETAGTDGKIIYYNPQFLNRLNEEEQVFILAHEVCHIAFNHILRSEGKDPETWNIATDAVINQFLKRDGLPMVEGGVDMEEAIYYDAEQLYDKLMKEKQSQNQSQSEQSKNYQNSSNQQTSSQTSSGKQDQQTSSSQQSSPKSSQKDSSENGKEQDSTSKQDVGHDTHSLWQEAVKKHQEEQTQTDKKEPDQVEKQQQQFQTLGEKEAFDKNKEEKKKALEDLKKSLAKQAIAGNTTNESIRVIEDIGNSKPILDWRYVLREAIKYNVDWSYRNATLEDGVVCANLEKIPIPETEIVLDTSGSINETLLKNFLRECKNILQHSRLKVGCFDTKFYGFHEIRREEDIEKIPFQGGGGTNFNAAVGAFTKRVENKIIFTDGQASMPNQPIDAIWIVFGDKKINPIGGKVIYITQEQLDKLQCLIEVNEIGRSR